MAQSLERAAQAEIRHLVARPRGRRLIFPDAAACAAAARRIADACARHRLTCLAWSVTPRCLHVVVRGTPSSIARAAEDWIAARPDAAHWLSTSLNADLYLLEVARHVLDAPVRAGHCRRAVDWPHSSARESLGLRPAPAWFDAGLLYRLLGPQDDHAVARLRRLIESG